MGERLSSVDAAWLHMDVAENLMVITGVMTFAETMDWERFRSVVERRILDRYPKFRMRVVESPAATLASRWEHDPDFRLDRHLTHVELPPPGGREQLQDLVSAVLPKPLDRSRPLWQLHLVDGVEERRSAVVARLHHAMADGMALASVLLSLTDEERDADLRDAEAGHDHEGDTRPWLLEAGRSAMAIADRAAGMARDASTALRQPSVLTQTLRTGAEGAAAVRRIVLRGNDPETALRGELGIEKRAAWSDPLPLDDVKQVGKATGTTVNDVLLAAMAGALRRYLDDRGSAVADLTAVVPVNLRPRDEPVPRELGNHFGLVYLTLPVGLEGAADRLREVHRRMNDLKSSPEPVVALGILRAMGMAPVAVQSLIVRTMAGRATAVMTNVPGPSDPLYLAGNEVDTIMFWAPQSGRLGMAASIFSYRGQVRVGVTTDKGLVPDPDLVIVAFREEFDALRDLVDERKEEAVS